VFMIRMATVPSFFHSTTAMIASSGGLSIQTFIP
jgi:hypothetical protein